MDTFKVAASRAGFAVAALGLLVVPRPALAGWPACGRAVVVAPGAQQHPAIATDGAGGAIVVWQDLRGPSVNIFARHVLANGDPDPAWPAEGRALLGDPTTLGPDVEQDSPAIVSDGRGGAIVAWQDNRSFVTATNIYAQHVLGDGTHDPAWPANGRAVCTAPGVQNSFVMIPDGASGAILAWIDGRSGPGVQHIFAGHVLAFGVMDPRWPLNGMPICTADSARGFLAIASDGSRTDDFGSGAIITWQDDRSQLSQTDVYAQRILNSGSLAPGWPVDGRAVSTSAGEQVTPAITSDGAAGAIVAWADRRAGGTAPIVAQHVLSSGAVDPGWPAVGRTISGGGRLIVGPPLLTSDGGAPGAAGAIVTWHVLDVHSSLFAQHVLGTGVLDPRWPAGGRALSGPGTEEATLDQAVSDGSGGALVVWTRTTFGQPGGDAVAAQHVLASGVLDGAYPEVGLVMCELPGQRISSALVATGPDAAIATWTDTRSPDTGADIYAMQVAAVPTLDVPGTTPPGLGFTRSGPNPARTSLTLRFALPHVSDVSLAIYDVNGRRVRELLAGMFAPGEHAIPWDMRDDVGQPAPVGVYFARLEVEGHVLTQRLTRLE